MKKVIVAYMSSCFSEIKFLKKFLYQFKKFNPGYPHELIVCFKKLNEAEKNKRLKLCKDIKIFDDKKEENDHEWGTLKRLCEINKDRTIFFMNDFSYPVCNNWLKKIMKHYKRNRFLGTSGSYSSHYSNSFFRHKKDNYLVSLFKLIYFFLNVPKFPNPHIRINGFLIRSIDYLEFIENKYVRIKLQSLLLESGKNNITNFFKKKNFDIFIVNKDGKKFNINNMQKSFTFAYSHQNKYLISDKQIRNYELSSLRDKIRITKKVWGKI